MIWWSLNTGYLVLFMQAGFALLTCGLVRKKNAGHLMMLNFAAYVIAFVAYFAVGFAFQFGAVAVNAAPLQIGGAARARRQERVLRREVRRQDEEPAEINKKRPKGKRCAPAAERA